MEKTFINKIKNNGELIVFIFFFLLFTFRLFIGSSIPKSYNQNYKENIERIKNELKDIDETSLKTNNINKQKKKFWYFSYNNMFIFGFYLYFILYFIS